MTKSKQSLLDWAITGMVKEYLMKNAEDRLYYDIKQVIDASRLENKDGVRPLLLDKKPGSNGWHFIFSLPPDVIVDDFVKRRKAFETYTKSTIEFKENEGTIIMSVYQSRFKDTIDFAFNPKEYPKMIAPIPIGYSPSGKLIVVDMSEVYHMLIGGVTGYGKTSELFGFAVSLLLAGCEVLVIDKKAIDFPLLSDYIKVAITEEEALDMLEKTVDDMEKRSSLLRESKVQKIQHMKELKYKVLIIDEAADIEKDKSWESIDALVRKARAGGIGLILATQKPSANTSKGFTDIRSNLAGRLCYYVNGDSTDSQIVLGKGNSRGAEIPAKPGRCVWKWKTEELLQSMYLDADAAIKILESNKIPKRKVVEEDEQLPTFLPPG